MRRKLITQMYSVVAMKSRTFASLPYSANEQVCRSWEGAQPGSQPRLASGNIPYHRYHAQFMNGGRPSDRKLSALHIFMSSNPLVQQFKLFWEFHKIHDFRALRSLLRDWQRIACQVAIKIVWYIVCFAYSLVVSTLLSY